MKSLHSSLETLIENFSSIKDRLLKATDGGTPADSAKQAALLEQIKQMQKQRADANKVFSSTEQTGETPASNKPSDDEILHHYLSFTPEQQQMFASTASPEAKVVIDKYNTAHPDAQKLLRDSADKFKNLKERKALEEQSAQGVQQQNIANREKAMPKLAEEAAQAGYDHPSDFMSTVSSKETTPQTHSFDPEAKLPDAPTPGYDLHNVEVADSSRRAERDAKIKSLDSTFDNSFNRHVERINNGREKNGLAPLNSKQIEELKPKMRQRMENDVHEQYPELNEDSKFKDRSIVDRKKFDTEFENKYAGDIHKEKKRLFGDAKELSPGQQRIWNIHLNELKNKKYNAESTVAEYGPANKTKKDLEDAIGASFKKEHGTYLEGLKNSHMKKLSMLPEGSPKRKDLEDAYKAHLEDTYQKHKKGFLENATKGTKKKYGKEMAIHEKIAADLKRDDDKESYFQKQYKPHIDQANASLQQLIADPTMDEVTARRHTNKHSADIHKLRQQAGEEYDIKFPQEDPLEQEQQHGPNYEHVKRRVVNIGDAVQQHHAGLNKDDPAEAAAFNKMSTNDKAKHVVNSLLTDPSKYYNDDELLEQGVAKKNKGDKVFKLAFEDPAFSAYGNGYSPRVGLRFQKDKDGHYIDRHAQIVEWARSGLVPPTITNSDAWKSGQYVHAGDAPDVSTASPEQKAKAISYSKRQERSSKVPVTKIRTTATAPLSPDESKAIKAAAMDLKPGEKLSDKIPLPKIKT